MTFSLDDIQDQTGRTVVLTGASTALGLEVARALACRGARVVLACPTLEGAAVVMAEVTEDDPLADLAFEPVDLSDLDMVRDFAGRIEDRLDRIDLLVNIASVSNAQWLGDLEQQIGALHLGSFALTNLLLGQIKRSAPARVVTVTSLEHRAYRAPDAAQRRGADDQGRRANVLFTQELARRLGRTDAPVRAVACHPGPVVLDLHDDPLFVRWRWGGQSVSPEAVVLPILFAATSPDVCSGDLVTRGPWWQPGPRVVAPTADRAPEAGERLWAWSEAETGVRWPLAA